MSHDEQLNILRQGTAAWNKWRGDNPSIRPDLSGADLFGVNLDEAHLSGVNLSQAELFGASLVRADLSGANLSEASLSEAGFCEATLLDTNFQKADLFEANFVEADLQRASFREANLTGAMLDGANLSEADFNMARLTSAYLRGANLVQADLSDANLSGAHLTGADLRGANLRYANLVETNLEKANLTECYVYGTSTWGVKLEGANQVNLFINSPLDFTITVDNLEIAQFIYLLIDNRKIRDVIDTITSKAVLILGRFAPQRKLVLDTLRDELRRRNYLPILFDFDKPDHRDLTETIVTLAHMARFIIADITGAKSIPQELQAIIPNLPSVPVQPLIERGEYEYTMFEHFRRYPWVLTVYQYDDHPHLITSLAEHVIKPAEAKFRELHLTARTR